MKPSLQFRLSQHLTLTPQLQQSIRLLQLSTVELNQEIDRMLMENPALEREDAEGEPEAAAPAPAPAGGAGAGGSTEPAAPDTDWSADIASSWRGPDDDDEGDRSFTAPDTPTLRDHLRGQLSLTNLGDRDRAFVQLLIDALDEDGYLTQPLEEIAALLPAEADPEELGIALRHLQNLEPAGVGARSPGECLALQLRIIPDEPARRLALDIVEKHLELLASRDYTRLKNLTGAGDEALRAAQRLIQALNPRPGAAYAKVETRYVIPDVIVRKQRGVWRASLNPDAMPRLRINRLYAELAAGARTSGAAIASQLQEARWLIKNVQQRFDTILRVSQAIVDQQRHFLEHGEVAMRPLVLREIAQTLGLHESTISRVTTQKYMATPRGTFELKYFFGSHVATEAGGAASSTAIRALIKQLVAAEDAKAPLSDARISQILGEQGIVVARRTIAKYREALQIPPVNQRKSL
ncbi:MAG: RNA polymerase factor sigma-54 [Betaproteobacteria bacterium]|nr:MAG: RNA polymerase factor sigma-54 [Betaproteobacteria bacterium]TMI00569.1 MAG: RNA polymerase factor sigma-54 [Betaproteobacteria bacterium]TMI11657.1 MAG: RNA polymerase factor sigma-54 [Betaproteobacteria bacterium]